MKIKLSDLSTETVRFRVKLDAVAVKEYADDVASLPAIDVFAYDGKTWIADGEHRKAAHEQAGLTEIEAVMHDGGRAECLAFMALQARTGRGVRYTSEDKRMWIDRELAIDPSRTNCAIAEVCGSTDKTVAARRKFRAPTQPREPTKKTPRTLKTSELGKRGSSVVSERDTRIGELLARGKTGVEIASELGCRAQQVSEAKARLGIPAIHGGGKKPDVAIEPMPPLRGPGVSGRPKLDTTIRLDNTVKELTGQGLGTSEIAKQLGRDAHDVSASKSRQGLCPKDTNPLSGLDRYIVSCELTISGVDSMPDSFWKEATQAQCLALAKNLQDISTTARRVRRLALDMADKKGTK